MNRTQQEANGSTGRVIPLGPTASEILDKYAQENSDSNNDGNDTGDLCRDPSTGQWTGGECDPDYFYDPHDGSDLFPAFVPDDDESHEIGFLVTYTKTGERVTHWIG